MAYAAFEEDEVVELIERLSESDDLTLLAGAGTSAEAQLPNWDQLLARLLDRAARHSLTLANDEEREHWAKETLRREGNLGAGAVVEALSGDQLQTWLPEELYGAGGAGDFLPGQISRQIAYLHAQFGNALTIMTVNYDDLIEQALRLSRVARANIKSYVRRRRNPPAGTAPVTHLHGYAGRDQVKGPLVLTEESYHRMQRGSSWQEEFVLDQLNSTDCLFVGTSLTDPNLIRYLYGHDQVASRKRAAVFIRQSDELPDEIRVAREKATTARFERCGVESVFLDHYCDVAQFLYEIGHRRSDTAGYVPLKERAKDWLHDTRRDVLGTGSEKKFRERQDVLSDRLRDMLTQAVAVAEAQGASLGRDERLQLVLWLADFGATEMTGWAHSDRAHRERRTVTPVPISSTSNWVSVRAFCHGTRYERDRDVYASRWKYVRGLPLIVTDPARLQVGCISVASTLPGNRSILEQMPGGARSEFNRMLSEGVVDLLRT